MSTTTNTDCLRDVSVQTDSFGRDPSLRIKENVDKYIISKYRESLVKIYSTMSWVDIDIFVSEEEERQLEYKKRCEKKESDKQRAIKQRDDQVQAEKRKALLINGMYDLEDGEILE